MGVYVITNGEGSYIHRDETSGKYVPIRSFNKATQWDSIVKANGILNNSIAKNIRSGYAVQLVDTEKTVVKENTVVQEDICFRNITDDNIAEWLSKINTIMEVMSGSDARQQELNGKLSDIDKEMPNGIPNNLMPYVTQVAARIREQLAIFGNAQSGIYGQIGACETAEHLGHPALLYYQCGRRTRTDQGRLQPCTICQ